MGLNSGSLSLVRYKVLGGRKTLSIAQLQPEFMANCAKKLRLSGVTQEESCGWDKPKMLDDEYMPEWDLSACRLADGLLLTMRMERRRVPAALLRWVVREKILAKSERREKPVGAKERRQIFQEAKHDLTAQALPELKFIEAYWSLKDQQIYLLSTSKRVQAEFEKLFFASFGKPHHMVLVKIDPPLMGFVADDWLQVANVQKKLEGLTAVVPMPNIVSAGGN